MPTDLPLPNKASVAFSPVTETQVMEIFALVQGNQPSAAFRRDKVGRSARAVLKNALFSQHVATKVIRRFLYGSDKPDKHRALGLSKDIVEREAARFSELEAPGVIRYSDAPPLTWRYAFYLFWSKIGSDRAESIMKIGNCADNSLDEAAALVRAIEQIERIDTLVANGEYIAAFRESQRSLVDGMTYSASRHLAIAMRLCTDPAHFEHLVRSYEKYCSDRLIRTVRTYLVDVLDQLCTNEQSDTPKSAEVFSFDGELPEAYDIEDTRLIIRNSPERATIWSALTSVPPSPKPYNVTAGFPHIVMQLEELTSANSITESAISIFNAQLSAMAETDAKLTLVVPQNHPLQELAENVLGKNVVPDFASAQDADASMVLVIDSFAPVPPELLNLLAEHEKAESPLPVQLEESPPAVEGSWRRNATSEQTILSTASRPCGLFSTNPASVWAAMAESQDRPGSAAEALGNIDPILLYAVDYNFVSPKPIERPVILISIGGEPILSTCSPHQICVPDNMLAWELSQQLADIKSSQDLPDDTPVIVQTEEFTYAEKYSQTLTDTYLSYGCSLPVAVKGLRLKTDDSKPTIIEDAKTSNLFRAAPLALSCLGIGEAIKALHFWGMQPASTCVVVFDPAAGVASAAQQFVRGSGESILRVLRDSPDLIQSVFKAFRDDLGGRILKHLENDKIPVPLQAYCLGQSNARSRMMKIGREASHTISESRQKSDMGIATEVAAFIAEGWLDTLIDDGHGGEVRNFLSNIFKKLDRSTKLKPIDFQQFRAISERCGLQICLAEAILPLSLHLCMQDRDFIKPIFSFVSQFGDPVAAQAAMFAILGQEISGKKRMKLIGRIAEQIVATTEAHEMISMIAMLESLLGDKLFECDGALKLLGERLLSSTTSRTPDLIPSSGLSRSAIIQLASIEKRFEAALVRGDRTETLALLHEISDRDGHLKQIIEITRTRSAELRSLKITWRDWGYPALGDRADRLAMAAILGDIEEILRSNAPYYIEAADNTICGAVASMVAGDPKPINILLRDWSEQEGLVSLELPAPNIEEEDRADTSGIVRVFEHFAAARSPVASSIEKDMPLVSAIITTFNADAELLRLAVTSILRQTWSNLEIILVDDASDEAARNTTQALTGIDGRIKFLEMRKNGGPYLARNQALDVARGDLIAIHDADDYAHPERFAHQIGRLAKRPKAMATQAGHIRIDKNGIPQFLRGMHLVDDGPMSTMFRREVFDLLGPFAKVRSRGDVEYRERIRQSLGPQCFDEMSCPLVFCFGAPTTLSLKTTQGKAGALRTFRHSFGQRGWCFSSENVAPLPLGGIVVPRPLAP